MRFSLFLDLDGTLIDFAAHPEGVTVPPRLITLLLRLDAKLQGAVAIASGRPIASLDKLLAPYQGAAIGIHGVERRLRDSPIQRQPIPVLPLSLMDKVQDLLIHEPSAFIENKGAALAVHHQRNGIEAKELEDDLRRLCVREAPEWVLMAGHQVLEIKPRNINKGIGMSTLMLSSPFAGTCPVAMGDDIADLDLFAAAHRYGGLVIAVGERVAGKGDLQLASPAGSLAFLERFLDASHLQTCNDIAALLQENFQ